MVISKRAVQEFMERPMRDSTVAKRMDPKKVDRILKEQQAEFLTEPREAQKVCFLLGWKYERYLFLLGCGSGKSKLTLDLFRNRRKVGTAKRMLVLVPNIVNLGAWEQEIQKHAWDLSCLLVEASGAEARWDQIKSDADVVVITYQGMASLVSPLAHDRLKGKNKRKMDGKLVDLMGKCFDVLVADECTSIKNPRSLWFKILRRFRKTIPSIYGLTGTPFNKSPEDLWSQFLVIDGGETLGETLGIYREAFFSEKDNYWGGKEYTFRQSMWRPLSSRLANRSVRYSDEESQDLPRAVGGLSNEFMFVPVQLPMTQRPYYREINEELREAHGNYQLVDNAYTRMRMICSGWLGAVTETGEKAEVVFNDNPVFDAVMDLIEKIPEEEKIVVVCWFNTTCRLLMERIKTAKHKVGLINGKSPRAAKKKAMESFCGEGGIRILVGSTAISKGVNLQAVSRYMIFVESPDSSLERTQIEKRIHREGGSGRPCYFYDIVARIGRTPTVHEAILESVKTGRNLHDILIDQKLVKAPV